MVAQPVRDSARGLTIRAAALALGTLAVIVAWQAFQVHALYKGQWSGLFSTGANALIPESLKASTFVHPARGSYDGQFYRFAAHAPWPPFANASSMDAPAMRYQRILVPAAAWLSSGGAPAWIDYAYVAVVDVSLAAGTCALFLLFAGWGRNPRWSLLLPVSAAAIFSMDRMVIDGTLSALFALAWLCWERGWRRTLWIVLALSGLTRETGLLLVAGFALALAVRREWGKAALISLAGAPALAWAALLRSVLGPMKGRAELSFLFTGLARRLANPAAYPVPWMQAVLRTVDFLAYAAIGISVAIAAVWAARQWREPPALAAALFVALALVLGGEWPTYEAPGLYRPLAPLLLYVAVEAARRRNWWALASACAVSAHPLAFSGKALLSGLRLL